MMQNSCSDLEEHQDDEALLKTKVCKTVEDAIDEIGVGRYQYLLFFALSALNMGDAAEIVLLSYLTPVLGCEWNLTDTQNATLVSTIFMGFLVGSFVAGWICDKWGRRPGYILSAVTGSVFGLASALSPNIVWMGFFRFGVGFAIGSSHSATALLAEILPTEQRSTIMGLSNLLWSAGMVLEAFFIAILRNSSWRILVAVSCFPHLLCLPLIYFVPESPRFLLIKGKVSEVKALIAHIAKENGKPVPALDFPNLVPASPLHDSVDADKPESSRRATKGFWDLFSPDIMLTTIVLMILWFNKTLLYYAMVLVTPVIMEEGQIGKPQAKNEACGISSEGIAMIAISAVLELPAILATVGFMRRYPHRHLFSLYAFLSSVMTAALTIVLLVDASLGGWLGIFMSLARGLSTGTDTIIWILTPEMYPTSIRSSGTGLQSGFSRFGSIIAPFLTESMNESQDAFVRGIVIMSSLCLIQAILIWAIPETAGMPMPDTVTDFKAGRRLTSQSLDDKHLD